MRAKLPIVVAIATLALSACTGSTDPKSGGTFPSAEPAAPSEFLMLATPAGVAIVNAETGDAMREIAGAVPAPDWSNVFTATSEGKTTTIAEIDASTGETESTSRVRGDFEIRAVSAWDGAVALMERSTGKGTSWAPAKRDMTTIVVADPAGSSKPQRFRLEGNFEPEAFSVDGEFLYMLQYKPALNPAYYRVTSLYLEDGEVWPVIGPNKSPVENMTATRLQQVAAPNGATMFTLYTNQPPKYLDASAEVPHVDDDERAFVHTLSLDGSFAVCIELPDSFGDASVDGSALAVSPDSKRVFAIDAEQGRIAIVAARRLEVIDTVNVDLSELGSGPISARVSETDEGRTLIVAGDAGLIAMDAATLTTNEFVATPGSVSGLALSKDGARLFVSWRGGIGLLDASTLETVGVLPSPVPGAVQYVGAIAS